MRTALPYTTRSHYITGKTALNIPAPENTGGDWHFREAFFGRGERKPRIFIAGEGEDWNTNAIWGNYGIHECSQVLKYYGLPILPEQKVYAANHYRAVLDMLYRCVKRSDYPDHLCLDDWFDNKEQKEPFIKLVKQLQPYLSIDEWQLVETWLKSQI